MMEDDQGAIVEGYAKSVWWAMRLFLRYGEQVKAWELEQLVLAVSDIVQAMNRLYREEVNNE
jgi:hypothetical protein